MAPSNTDLAQRNQFPQNLFETAQSNTLCATFFLELGNWQAHRTRLDADWLGCTHWIGPGLHLRCGTRQERAVRSIEILAIGFEMTVAQLFRSVWDRVRFREPRLSGTIWTDGAKGRRLSVRTSDYLVWTPAGRGKDLRKPSAVPTRQLRQSRRASPGFQDRLCREEQRTPTRKSSAWPWDLESLASWSNSGIAVSRNRHSP